MTAGGVGRFFDQWRRLRGPVLILLVAAALREGLAFWTGHPYDFESWIRTAHVVAQSPSVDPYSSPTFGWGAVPGVSFAYAGNGQQVSSAAYPPFWPLILGGLYRVWEASGTRSPFLLYWLLKQPQILGDLLTGALLYFLAVRWTTSESVGRSLLWIWALFPYDIVISAVWGQFDSLVAALVLAGLLMKTARDRSLLNGFGIFVKWVTVVFVPFEFFRNRGLRRLWAPTGILMAVALTAASFELAGWSLSTLLSGGGFSATTASQIHGGAGGMNFARILTSSPYLVSVELRVPFLVTTLGYLWVPAVVLAGWWVVRRQRITTPAKELEAVMFILVVFFVTRVDLNEQYFVYLFPLMLLDIACFHPERRRFFLVLVSLCSLFLVLNNALGIWFASPADPSLWQTALELNSGLAPFPPAYAWFRSWTLNLLAIVISVTLFQMAYLLVRERTDWTPWLLWPLVWCSPPSRLLRERPPVKHPVDAEEHGSIRAGAQATVTLSS